MLSADMPPKCGCRDLSSKAANSVSPSNSVRWFSFDSISKGRNWTKPDGSGTLHELNKISRRIVAMELSNEWCFTKRQRTVWRYHRIYRYRAQPLASFVFVRVFVAGLIRDHVLWSKFTEVERAPTIVFGSGGAKRLDRILPPIYGKDVVTARPFTNVPIFKSSLRSPRSTVLMDSWQKEGLS
jgi:hypothetical protein